MESEDSTKDAIAKPCGVSSEAKAGRVAAIGVSRSGGKRRGKYELHIIGGTQFNANGILMRKERVVDRPNDHYKELVTNFDTGEVVHYDEGSLSDHKGHGSAKLNSQKT